MKDLTVGKPGRVLLTYSLPLFGSIIFQQLYNIADSFVAGHFISTEALAAVGNSSEITLIFIAIAFGCNIGTSVVTANLFGQKEMKQVHTCVTTALIFCGILGVVLSAVGMLTSEWMLTLLDTPVETMKDSVAYIQIYLMSYVFLMLYQVATGIFSALGDSKTPFYFLAVSSIANIFVDILFVRDFHMGVPGVAWATFLCQSISGIVAVIFVLKKVHEVVGGEKCPLFSGVLLKKMLIIAIPSAIQQSFISVGNILVHLGVKTENYIKREIYSVREGIQYDGLDYYVYEFSKENGQDIVKKLDSNSKWSKNRLDDSILDDFEYNKEVLEIKNGYYHYELVCRTSDENKKHNFTKEEATGWEIGVYDVDKNILYYYWQSM